MPLILYRSLGVQKSGDSSAYKRSNLPGVIVDAVSPIDLAMGRLLTDVVLLAGCSGDDNDKREAYCIVF